MCKYLQCLNTKRVFMKTPTPFKEKKKKRKNERKKTY